MPNTIVYLETALTGAQIADTRVLEISILNYQFSPQVILARVGQPVRITIKDDGTHSLLFGSNKNYVLQEGELQRIGSFREITFGQEELFVSVQCMYHPWEHAYVGVVANESATLTDSDGNFSLIAELLPGTYELHAVQPRMGKASVTIQVGETPAEIVTSLEIIPNPKDLDSYGE